MQNEEKKYALSGLLKSLENAQENLHKVERELILIEKKLLDLIDNDLVDESIAQELISLSTHLLSQRILFNKIWRDLLLEYQLRQNEVNRKES